MTTENQAPTEQTTPTTPVVSAPLEVTVEAVEPVVTAPAADAGKVEPVVYNPTGDVGLDMTLKFVGDLGYAPDHPAMAAAINGNFTLLEAELASKGVTGYEAYIKLGQQAYTSVSTKTAARQAADKAAVEGIAGGAENWQAMTAWAGANADEGEKSVLQAQLAKGGLEAQMAATWLATNYNRSTGVSTDGAGPAVATTAATASASAGALDPKSYGAEVVKARQAHKGGGFEESSAYKQLVQRRMMWQG